MFETILSRKDSELQNSIQIVTVPLYPFPPPSAPPLPQDPSDDESENTKFCRQCFDADENGSTRVLIAPCVCRGTRTWVHRDCLNTWRATSNQNFDMCEICAFTYRYEEESTTPAKEQARKRAYAWKTTLYLTCVMLCIGSVMSLLGLLVYGIDVNRTISDEWFDHVLPTFWAYEFVGIMLFFFIIGCVGLLMWCCNTCRGNQSSRSYIRTSPHRSYVSNPTYNPPCIICCWDQEKSNCICCVSSRSSGGVYIRRCPDCCCCYDSGSSKSTCDCDCKGCECKSGNKAGETAIVIILIIVLAIILFGIFYGMGVFIEHMRTKMIDYRAIIWRQQLVDKYKVKHFEDPPTQEAISSISTHSLAPPRNYMQSSSDSFSSVIEGLNSNIHSQPSVPDPSKVYQYTFMSSSTEDPTQVTLSSTFPNSPFL